MKDDASCPVRERLYGNSGKQNGVDTMSKGAVSVDSWKSKIARQYDSRPEYLIPILQHLQDQAGYLSPEAMLAAARYLRIPESKVYGVASFYAQFNFEPQGKHKLTICRGTACHVRGSGRLEGEMATHLDVKPGGTTPDMLFTLESVACVGSCALAPVVVVDGQAHGRQTVASLKRVVKKIRDAEGAPQPAKAAEPEEKPAKKKPKKPAKKKPKKPAKKKPKKPAKKKPKKPAKKKPKKPAKKKPKKPAKKPAKKKPKKPAKKPKKKPKKKARKPAKKARKPARRRSR